MKRAEFTGSGPFAAFARKVVGIEVKRRPRRRSIRRPPTTPRRRTPARTPVPSSRRRVIQRNRANRGSTHGQATHQLRPAGKDGRGDAQGNGALPARGHAAAGKLGGARACAGLLLVLRQFLARHLPQRRARSLHQGTVPALRLALGAVRVLRQPALGEGDDKRRRDRGSGARSAQLREIRPTSTSGRRRRWPMPRRSPGISIPTTRSGIACTSISASRSWSSSAA